MPQPRILAWIASAHAEAEQLEPAEREAFRARLARVIDRVACPPAKIGARATVLDLDAAWGDSPVYDLSRSPHGSGSGARTRVFAELVDAYFREAYARALEAPDELIHVTCTGYVSPSGAQRVVAARRWPTRVTHAYQMGCYAAVPAVRIACGFLATAARRVDIAHTELCSLHLDPSDHGLEQLVVQSLFADGLIRYRVERDTGGPGLRVLGALEQIVPGTADAMTWQVGDYGMQMTLAAEVPDLLAAALRPFVLELFQRAQLPIRRLGDGVLAVHPGGPKIIDRVRETLELDEAQVRTSRAVLFDHGNMSSATLPHIWMRVLDDPGIPRGTLIPSLAFGPGLTLCGLLLEKR